MSIFNDTFKDFTWKQLKLRQSLLDNNSRSPESILWMNSKTAWVRMTSLMNFLDKKTNSYTDSLSKDLILDGGSIKVSKNDNNKYSIKQGIGNGTYNKNYSYMFLKDNKELGLKPMPGITKFSSKHKGSFGSLKSGNVEFTCHNVSQLEDCEYMFMRPGNDVLIEYGWSYVLENEGKIIPYNQLYSFDPFKPMSYDELYNLIEQTESKFQGNYSAMLGTVINYNWNYSNDGSYKCMVETTSKSEVLSSLKLNLSKKSNITIEENKTEKSDNIKQTYDDKAQTPVLDEFQTIFGAFKSFDVIGNNNISTPPIDNSGKISIPFNGFSEDLKNKILSINEKDVKIINKFDGNWNSIPLTNRKIFLSFFKELNEKGFELSLNTSYRSEKENNRVGGAKSSYHLSGMSVDISLFKNGIKVAGKGENEKWLKNIPDLRTLTNKYNLTWGGDFLHDGVYDSVHFDLRKFVDKNPNGVLTEIKLSNTYQSINTNKGEEIGKTTFSPETVYDNIQLQRINSVKSKTREYFKNEILKDNKIIEFYKSNEGFKHIIDKIKVGNIESFKLLQNIKQNKTTLPLLPNLLTDELLKSKGKLTDDELMLFKDDKINNSLINSNIINTNNVKSVYKDFINSIVNTYDINNKNLDKNLYLFNNSNSFLSYISLDLFLSIIKTYFIPVYNDSKNGKELIVDIVLPCEGKYSGGNIKNYGGHCISHPDQITIDPTFCITRNNTTSLYKDPIGKILDNPNINSDDYKLTLGYDLFGFHPSDPNDSNNDGIRSLIVKYNEDINNLKEYHLKGKNNIGLIGNIYLNIDGILNFYNSTTNNENGDINIVDFINSLLNRINYSLGSINNFGIFADKNKVYIIDKFYSNLEPKNFDKVVLSGINSCVRNINLESKIFQNQTNMFAIITRGSGTNIGSINRQTWSTFNNKVESRISRGNPDYLKSINSEKIQYDLENNILVEQVKSLSQLKYNVIDFLRNGNLYGLPPNSPLTSNSVSFNSIQNSFMVDDINFNNRVILPLGLNLTFDGISGIYIGNVFQVDGKNIIPKDYINNNNDLGFIVTGVEDLIVNNDWTTTINTQTSPLNNDLFEKSKTEQYNKLINNKDFQNIINSLYTELTVQNILKDLLGYIVDKFSKDYKLNINIDSTLLLGTIINNPLISLIGTINQKIKNNELIDSQGDYLLSILKSLKYYNTLFPLTLPNIKSNKIFEVNTDDNLDTYKNVNSLNHYSKYYSLYNEKDNKFLRVWNSGGRKNYTLQPFYSNVYYNSYTGDNEMFDKLNIFLKGRVIINIILELFINLKNSGRDNNLNSYLKNKNINIDEFYKLIKGEDNFESTLKTFVRVQQIPDTIINNNDIVNYIYDNINFKSNFNPINNIETKIKSKIDNSVKLIEISNNMDRRSFDNSPRSVGGF